MTSPMDNEFHGKTVEEATEAALAALGLKHHQVEIEILSRGSRGLLGFGAEEARVRVTPLPVTPKPEAQAAPKPPKPSRPEPAALRSAPAPAPAQPPASAPTPRRQPAAPVPAAVAMPPAATPAPAPSTPAPTPAPVDGEQDVNQLAEQLLQGLLDRMDIRAKAEIVPYRGVLDDDQEAPLVLNIEGEDLGILIGRRAETLNALQYLTRLMVNHRAQRWIDLVVDVEGYKARHEEQLVRLAERMAERVVSTGRAVALEAMPARERRIVHITLRNHPQVTTQSVGEGDQRKVTIIPRA